MYWGPYLYKTTNSVVSLCKQFEVLVTNGKRTFKDVKFLVLNESLERYFDLAKLGNVDWKATLDNLSNFGEGLSWEAVKEDFQALLILFQLSAVVSLTRTFLSFPT